MKILVVRSVLYDMGPGTQPLFLAQEMRRRGHESVFVTSGGVFLPEVEKHGFTVEIEPMLAPNAKRMLFAPLAVVRLAGIIRKHRPDVVHGHNAASTLLAKLAGYFAGRDLPCVTSVRGVEERESHQFRNRIWKLTPGKLLGVCEKTRQRLLSFNVPDEKIHVSYNGVDLSRFNNDRSNGPAIRQEFGLDEDAVVVGTVGAITGPLDLDGPSKGQHNLVKAMGLLRDKHPQLRVLLVGDGHHRETVEAVAKELGLEDRVVFAGRRFDVPEMLSAMDIYCLASIWGEFFPNSILEAMAMGLPWIGSDIAGLSELTAGDEAGWVSPIGDVEALATNLDRLVADSELRRRRGERARREVEDRFSIQRVCDNILNCYTEQQRKLGLVGESS